MAPAAGWCGDGVDDIWYVLWECSLKTVKVVKEEKKEIPLQIALVSAVEL